MFFWVGGCFAFCTNSATAWLLFSLYFLRVSYLSDINEAASMSAGCCLSELHCATNSFGFFQGAFFSPATTNSYLSLPIFFLPLFFFCQLFPTTLHSSLFITFIFLMLLLFFLSFVCACCALCAQTRALLRNAGLASASTNKPTGAVLAGVYPTFIHLHPAGMLPSHKTSPIPLPSNHLLTSTYVESNQAFSKKTELLWRWLSSHSK